MEDFAKFSFAKLCIWVIFNLTDDFHLLFEEVETLQTRTDINKTNMKQESPLLDTNWISSNLESSIHCDKIANKFIDDDKSYRLLVLYLACNTCLIPRQHAPL